MKGYLLEEIGKFRYAEVDEPVCGDDEVIVDVVATGICGSDIPRIYRTGTYAYPLIPGHEFSGIVSKAGKNVDRSWIGKRVGVFPLIPCGKCSACLNQNYELCSNYSYLGSRRAGGFGERVAVPVWNLIQLPENVSFEQAATLEPMAVAAHAMNLSGISVGCSAAICGLGTIGLLLYMLLREKGVKEIYLVGNKRYQEEMAVELGFDRVSFCNDRVVDGDKWLENMAESGVDVLFECTGTAEGIGLALRHTAPKGTVMLVGNPSSDMSFDRQTFWGILRKQLTVKGAWNSSFTHKDSDDWHYCLELIARKKIMPEKLISHRLPFDQLDEGTRIMRDKQENYTKIMALL